MLELLPPYLREYTEMKEIMGVEGVEIEVINSTHNQIVDNRYITTCNDTGIKRFETLLEITPLSNDTLDDRKLRCIARWNQVLPYNYNVLKSKLASVCGNDGYSLDVDFDTQTISVEIALGVKNQFNIVAEMIEGMVPCNMVTNIVLMYNTHETLGAYTHGQLAAHTYGQIRDEVL